MSHFGNDNTSLNKVMISTAKCQLADLNYCSMHFTEEPQNKPFAIQEDFAIEVKTILHFIKQ